MTATGELDGAASELEERVRRYPADRYPIQHATGQFHLGVALSATDRLADADAALATAVAMFDPARLPVEHAKARNARGAVLRSLGRPDEAASEFAAAASIFETTGNDPERAAALHNLGLARRDLGDVEEARRLLTEARAVFAERNLTRQAGAAARELGTTSIMAGELDEAREPLLEAISLAERGGDLGGLGSASNTLGLVELAEGRTAEAVALFRSAAGAHPISVRPGDHAMAKANLALAYERAGDAARARLAARQAVRAPVVPPAVAEQADAILGRLGRPAGDLLRALEDEPAERWPTILREELVRWAQATLDDREAESDALIEGILDGDGAVDLCEAWVGGLLELPTDPMELLIRSAMVVLATRPAADRIRFAGHVKMAAARFHAPQLIRLEDTFNRLADELGQEPLW